MPSYRNTTNGTLTGNGQAVSLAWREFYNGGVGIQVTGTFSGTLTFQLTIDGTNFVSALTTNVTTGAQSTTTSSTGIFFFNVVGALSVRVSASSWSSGTATVTLVNLPG
jgi:hypothetical protein